MGYMNEFPHSRMFDSDLRELLEMFQRVNGLPSEWAAFEKSFTSDLDKTLNDAIQPIFNTYKTDIDELNSRMNTFTRLPEGSTTGDAELIDGRVDYKGFVYANIGSHIRAIGREVADKFAQLSTYVTPQMFGALGNNEHDDTEAIQAAIDFVESQSGGMVFFPNGVYVISDTLTVKHHGVKLLGECAQSTYIKQTNPTKGGIELYSYGKTLSGVSINNLSIFCVEGSTGIGIHYNGCVNAFAENVIIDNFKIGLKLSGTGNSFVKAVGITSSVANAFGFQHGLRSVSTQYIDIYAGFSGAAADSGIGFVASQGNIADFTINYLDVGNGYCGVYLDGADSPQDTPAADIRLYEIVCDGCRERCIDIQNIGERGSVLLVGGWLNPLRRGTVRCLNITNSSNIIVKGVTFHQLASSAPTFWGVVGYMSKNVIIDGCQFINVLNPINASSIERWNIEGNIIDLYANDRVESHAIYLASAKRINVLGNIIKGTFLTGITTENTCAKCIVATNNLDGSTINMLATESVSENNLT